MQQSMQEVMKAMQTLDKGSPWDADAKVSDDFLTPLFKTYYRKLNLPNLMEKKYFYKLAMFVPQNEVDDEVRDKLDAISAVAEG